MKNGLFEEGKATLRMKVTLEDSKQDPVAYRIKCQPHPRTGSEWCIYPTYDYAHCLCDSIENITHSFCTREFQIKYIICTELYYMTEYMYMCVLLVSDAPPTTGCAMLWISIVQSSGSLADSISTTQLYQKGEYKLSSLPELSGWFGSVEINVLIVAHQLCSGWDDPRLFTLSGLRRRGFPPEAINKFCDEVCTGQHPALIVVFTVLPSTV